MKTYLHEMVAQVRVSALKTPLSLITLMVILTALMFVGGYYNYAYAAQNTDAGYGTSGENSGSQTTGKMYQGGSDTDSGSDSGDATSESSSDREGGKPEGVGQGGSTGVPGGSGGGDEESAVGNNLSFPTITADGFALTAVSTPSFSVVYSGPYNNLSTEEKALLEGRDWYAQKTEGNLWQAEYAVNKIGDTLGVYGVDWGDNVEAVNPVIGRPFRVEVTLYNQPEETMDGYTMELLAFPSSPNEVQGTNSDTYKSEFATIISSKPMMRVQRLGDVDVTTLEWNGSAWVSDGETLPITDLSFAAELNVGGKYIYGASKGGWKPVEAGTYRLTLYVPESDISFAEAVVGNYDDWIAEEVVEEEDEETGAAKPVIDAENNLTYVDVTVVTNHEGRKPANPGEGEEVVDLSVVEAVEAAETCEPYLTDYMGLGLENDPVQVVLLQKFLNDILDLDLVLDGVYDQETADAVSLFQVTYAEDTLQPWVDAGYEDVDLTTGTGYVGVTTLELINEMMCQ